MSEYMIFWDDGQISKVAADRFSIQNGLVTFFEICGGSGSELEVGVFFLSKLQGFCRTDNMVEINGEDEE